MRELIAITVILSACTATTGLPVSERARPPPLPFGVASDEAQPWSLRGSPAPTGERMYRSQNSKISFAAGPFEFDKGSSAQPGKETWPTFQIGRVPGSR